MLVERVLVIAVLALWGSVALGQGSTGTGTGKVKGTGTGEGKVQGKGEVQGSTELLFQLAVPNAVTPRSVLLELSALGKTRFVTLTDDGSASGDQPHDGVWIGRARVSFAHLMTVRMFIGFKGETTVTTAYEGLVRMVDSRLDGASWRLERGRSGWVALPTAAAYPGRQGTVSEVLPTVAVFGWGVFLVAVVGLLLRRFSRDRAA